MTPRKKPVQADFSISVTHRPKVVGEDGELIRHHEFTIAFQRGSDGKTITTESRRRGEACGELERLVSELERFISTNAQVHPESFRD